jgi:hypothetical protein
LGELDVAGIAAAQAWVAGVPKMNVAGNGENMTCARSTSVRLIFLADESFQGLDVTITERSRGWDGRGAKDDELQIRKDMLLPGNRRWVCALNRCSAER